MDLSSRELQVAGLIAREFAEKEIADKLCISPLTVHTHAKNIRKKIGAKNNVGIATRYLLSLDKPKSFIPGMLFLMLQLFMVINTTNVDMRKPVNASRVKKIKRYGA
jgi:DNA-binding CsgD family transcriptional regulator